MIFINLVQATVGPSGKPAESKSAEILPVTPAVWRKVTPLQAFLHSTLVSVAHCVLDSRSCYLQFTVHISPLQRFPHRAVCSVSRPETQVQPGARPCKPKYFESCTFHRMPHSLFTPLCRALRCPAFHPVLKKCNQTATKKL